jgi:hypothetical protein
MLTLKKIRRFITIRNHSGYDTNLQFQIDLGSADLKVTDLGKPRTFTLDGFPGYEWTLILPNGARRMVEFGRTLHLEGDKKSAEMFALMREKARYTNDPL